MGARTPGFQPIQLTRAQLTTARLRDEPAEVIPF